MDGKYIAMIGCAVIASALLLAAEIVWCIEVADVELIGDEDE